MTLIELRQRVRDAVNPFPGIGKTTFVGCQLIDYGHRLEDGTELRVHLAVWVHERCVTIDAASPELALERLELDILSKLRPSPPALEAAATLGEIPVLSEVNS